MHRSLPWKKAFKVATAKNNSDKNIIIVAGPTASGKSALALAVAELLNGEIINGDSMQMYREFQVLTARPGEKEEARVAHHLYGALSITERCSAGIWLKMALEVIADVRARGRRPIICGGTGLYLKVLMEGIAPVPAVPQKVTDELRNLYLSEGGAAFHKRLAQVDPSSASKLVPTDRQRLVRAYGVVKVSGRALGDWQREQLAGSPIEAQFLNIVLSPPRDALYQRINQRFDAMLLNGAITEVAAVLAEKLDPNLPAMKALGVQNLSKYLIGECDLDEAANDAKRATRNLAKRQLTWFRNKIRADLVVENFGGKEVMSGEMKPFLDALYQT